MNLMKSYQIADADAWVQLSDSRLSPRTDTYSPFHFYLVDYQELVTDSKICAYRRTIEHINDASRIEDASLFIFELSSTNHEIVFHSISIIRNGEIIDALNEDNILINRRERSLENHITDQRITVSVSIDDLRVGDIVDYSATDITHAGDHPLNGKYYHSRFWLNWACPVYHQKIRIVNQSGSDLQAQICTYDDGKFTSSIEPVGPGTELVRIYDDLIPAPLPETVPPWFWSDFMLVAKSSKWEELSAYMFGYYEAHNVLEDSQCRDQIPASCISEDRRESLINIVRFVQNDIRYKGENHGIFTHTPKTASETLKKRHGDCKDKSNLLVCLLGAIGIKSHLTLVSTSYGAKLHHLIPSLHHFNHMIVHVELYGKDYYFDPTIKKEAGDLEHSALLNFGYGLVLSKDGSGLQKISNNISVDVYRLKHTFDFTDQGDAIGTMHIQRKYYSHRANNMRYQHESTTREKIIQDYLGYAMDETDFELQIILPITVTDDDLKNNTLTTEETYKLCRPVTVDKDRQMQLLTSIYTEFPVSTDKRYPLQIDLDGRVTHEIEVIYKHRPAHTFQRASINNTWFSYVDGIKSDGKTLVLSATAVPHKRYVTSQCINDYQKDVEAMKNRSVNRFPYISINNSPLLNLGYWMLFAFFVSAILVFLISRVS